MIIQIMLNLLLAASAFYFGYRYAQMHESRKRDNP